MIVARGAARPSRGILAILLAGLILLAIGWGDSAGAATPAPAKAKPVSSKTKSKPMPVATAKANSQQPIDITADRLDVDQNSQVATFSGNVRAVQADITLRTQTLKVYYDQKAKKDPTTKSNGTTSQSAIRRLEASGGVTIQAPGESAIGQRGTYDVANRVARLFDDVVMTRGTNVVKGQRATIDFDSGRSRVEGGAGGKGGRVHGVFVPQKSGNGAVSAPTGGR